MLNPAGFKNYVIAILPSGALADKLHRPLPLLHGRSLPEIVYDLTNVMFVNTSITEYENDED